MTNPGPLGGDGRPLTGPDADPLGVGQAPAPYEAAELRDPTPAYDMLAEETATDPAPLVVEDVDYTVDRLDVAGSPDPAPASNPSAGGVLSAVREFAAQKPAAFIGAALLVGWLVGKVFSSSDD
jgi:hypothetical protein